MCPLALVQLQRDASFAAQPEAEEEGLRTPEGHVPEKAVDMWSPSGPALTVHVRGLQEGKLNGSMTQKTKSGWGGPEMSLNLSVDLIPSTASPSRWSGEGPSCLWHLYSLCHLAPFQTFTVVGVSGIDQTLGPARRSSREASPSLSGSCFPDFFAKVSR